MTTSFGPLRIDPDDPRPLYVQIMDEVRWAIARGVLGPNDPLPSVRELAGGLRVNPTTVLQGYRELEREGVVHVQRGRGTFVSPGLGPARVRSEVAREVARRCLNEAARAGLGPDDLIHALRSEIDSPSPEAPDGP